MATFRSAAVTNSPSTNISSPRGADVITMNIVNKHSAAIFVRFYDLTVASFQDTPFKTFQVAANSEFNLNNGVGSGALFSTSLGLCVRAVTDAGDNGNTAPATLPVIELQYN